MIRNPKNDLSKNFLVLLEIKEEDQIPIMEDHM